MTPSRSLCATFCLLCAILTVSWGLRIGAFNVRVFGLSKARNDNVMGVLAKIAVRYDILLVQEVKDKSGEAIQKLQQRIKRDYGVTMTLTISERLGRSRSKEQYAFLYRADKGLSVVDTLHFPDGDEASGQDRFEREPFIVRFYAAKSKVKDFSLIALHTVPLETVEELSALSDVIRYVRQEWDTNNILVLGDLNADCRYVPKKDWINIEVRHDPDLTWLIGDDVDTTVNANTDCAYDRFIVAGRSLKNAVVPGSAKVFDFQTKYGMTTDEALAVSDHYPIELELLSERRTTTTQKPVGSVASQRVPVMKMLRQFWDGMVRTFTRWRSDSDL